MSVFLGYHYPCLDGVYSVCSPFLFFRDIQRHGFTAQDFIQYIHQFQSYDDINQSFYEWKGVDKDSQEEEVKASDYNDFSHEYSTKILNDVVYLPCRLNSNGYFNFPYHQYTEEFLNNSVIFLMDYSSGSAENIRNLCKTFSKLIILDHHLTFEHILEELAQDGGIPNNLMFLYNKLKSGATVSFEFFEKVKGGPLLSNKEKYVRFQEVLSYVEDNDIKAGKVENSAQFVSGIRKRKMNFDATEYYDVFLNLIEAVPEVLIEIGTQEEKRRIQKSTEIIQQKRIIYLGGKNKDKTARFGRCYGVEIDDLDLRSEVGRQLAELSYKDGLENMGFVYSHQLNKQIKVSVRSVKGLPGGDCESVARGYQGGGHYNASGFFLTPNEFKRWI